MTETRAAKIGSLQVKTVPTVHGTARVVLLPGHELGIEHFFPNNQTHLSGISQRTRLVQSNLPPNPRFYAKHNLKQILQTHHSLNTWTATSEARLARYANNLGVKGVKIEEPLAVVFRKPGKKEVIYREIEDVKLNKYTQLGGRQKAAYNELITKLKENGIELFDHSMAVDKHGIVRIIDTEAWQVEPEKAKELGLKKAWRK